MTERTLRNWRAAAVASAQGEIRRAPGRPARSVWDWRRLLRAIEAVIARSGKVGWRVVHAALDGAFSTDAVQRGLAWWNRRRAERLRREAAARAVRIAVPAPGLVWAMDGTHAGRDAAGRAYEAQVLMDRGSRLVLAADLGLAASGEDAIVILESAQRLWGELPLVLFTDNGPPYKSADFLGFLKRHHIVHVPNLPHTPQHNAAAERMNRDVKDAAQLGKGVLIASLHDAARSLLDGIALVNVRPRGVLGGESALARHLSADRWYTPQHRKEIHDTVRAAVDAVPPDIGTPRQYLLARRRAALEVLHALGIIHITRGCGPS